jgi:hypothetical protein
MSKKKISDSLDDGSLAFFVQGLILLYMLSLSLETVPVLTNTLTYSAPSALSSPRSLLLNLFYG